MKKFIVSLAFIFIQLVSLNALEDNKESIQIVRSDQQMSKTERDNSVFIRAFIDRELNEIELEYNEIGEACVYIIDSANKIVFQSFLPSYDTSVYIPAPVAAGRYVLVIWSETYYGEGYFNCY